MFVPEDFLPTKLVDPHEWRCIERAVAQRAQLLELIVADAYGPQRLIEDAFLPAALVLGHPDHVPELQGVPLAGGRFLYVIAFDLARGGDGWRVVAQHTEAPVGLGDMVDRGAQAHAMAHVVDMLRAAAQVGSQHREPRLALLMSGSGDQGRDAHVHLARHLGLPALRGSDLTVRNEVLYFKTVHGLEPVDGLLRCLGDASCDPLQWQDRAAHGVPALVQVVRAGRVVLGNALGSGFLQSSALHGFLPAIAQRMLRESLALPSRPTLWCGERVAWLQARPGLAEWEIHATHVHDEGTQWGAVSGASLSALELEAWRYRIDQHPSAYTLCRPARAHEVSMRVYAVADGQGGWQVVPADARPMDRRRNDAGLDRANMGGASPGPSDTLASTTAENLFWMGRYAERIECQMSLVALLQDLKGRTTAPGTRLADAMADLLRRFGLMSVQAADAGLGTQPLQGAVMLDGVRFNVDAMTRLAGALPGGPALEHWPEPGAFEDLDAALQALRLSSAPWRGPAEPWAGLLGGHFWDVGRLLERLVNHAGIAQAFLHRDAADGAEGLSALQFLLGDDHAWRAPCSPTLGCLRQSLCQLPSHPTAEAPLTSLLPQDVSAPDNSAMLALMSRLIETGGRIASEVSRRYFAHAQAASSREGSA